MLLLRIRSCVAYRAVSRNVKDTRRIAQSTAVLVLCSFDIILNFNINEFSSQV